MGRRELRAELESTWEVFEPRGRRRPITKKDMTDANAFKPSELAFFDGGRTWLEIVERFKEGRRVGAITDAVMDADNEGGRGFLRWSQVAQQWSLTPAGRKAAGL